MQEYTYEIEEGLDAYNPSFEWTVYDSNGIEVDSGLHYSLEAAETEAEQAISSLK